jgi:hypothetical protein
MAAIDTTELVAPNRSLEQIVYEIVEMFDLQEDTPDAEGKAIIEAEIDRFIATEFAAKVDGIAFFDRRADSEVKLRKEMISGIKSSIDTWGKRKSRVRDAVRRAMDTLGISLLKGKIHSVGLRQGVESLVIEEADLPEDYKSLRTTVTVEVDEAAVKRDLKAGKLIPGARLVRGDEVLTIR